MNEELVVVKLVDGDQFIAQLLNYTDHGLLVLRPITIKMQQVITPDGLVERLTTSAYCPLSGDESFSFDARHVVFVNRLSDQMSDQYHKLSKELYESLRNPDRFKPAEEQEERVPEEPKVNQDKKVTYH